MKKRVLCLAFGLALLGAAAARAQAPFSIGAPLAGRAIFGCTGVAVTDGATVRSEGVSSYSAMEGRGHLASNGDILVSSRAVVMGDVAAGPGHSATVTADAAVSGLTAPAGQVVDCSPVDIAKLLASLGSNDNGRIPRTALGKSALGGAAGDALVLGSHDSVTLPAGTYVFSAVDLSGRAHVTLQGETHVLVTGDVRITGNSALNPAGGAFRLRFFTAGQHLTVESFSTLGAIVYAPSAEAIVDSESRVLGTLFASAVTVRGASAVIRIVDDTPPVLTLFEPGTSGVPVPSAVRVRGLARDPETAVTAAKLNGKVLTLLDDGSFDATVDATGFGEVRVDAENAMGLTTTVRVPLCGGRPALAILSPANGSLVGARTGSVSGTCGTATSVTVNGHQAAVADGAFRLDGVDFGPDGIVVIRVVASSSCAQTALTTVFTLDTQAPLVSIDTPSSGSVVGTSPVAVSGTFVEANLAGITVNGVVAAISGNRFTAAAVPIPDGTSTLVAEAQDKLGRVGVSAPVSITLETQTPSVVITSPAPGTLTGDATATVSGTADVPGLASVRVAGRTATLSGRSFTVSGVPLVEGDNRLVAEAIDTGGRSTFSQPVVVTLDSQPPDVALDTTSFPALTNDTAITVSGTVSDPHLGPVSVNGVAALVSGGRFTAANVPLVEGDNAIRAHAVDALGHAADSATATANRDTQGPAVTITSPAPGAQLANASVTVSGAASDPHLASVTVNGLPATLTSGTFTVSLTLPEGDSALVANAVDSLGNAGASPAVPVTVDTIAPVVAIDAPADPLTGSAFVTVTGTVVEPHLLSVTVGGVPAAASGGRFVATNVPLVEGTQQITAVAFDTFGHRGESQPVTYRLDSTPPVLTIDKPPSDSACFVPGTPITVSGHVGLPGGASARPVVTLVAQPSAGAPQTFTAVLDSAGTGWSVAAVDLGPSDGLAALTASTHDALGLQVRVLRSVRVKASVPTISLLLDGGAFPGNAAGAAAAPGEIPALLGRAVRPSALVTDGPDAAPPVPVLTLDGAPYAGGVIGAEGTHLLAATATDCAGHSASRHALFTIDVTPPRLLSTNPADAATVGSAPSAFSGTSDPDLVAATVNGLSATVGSGTFTLSPFSWKEGLNTVVIELIDRAGNRASYTRSFTAKTLGPSIEILESGFPLASGTTFYRTVTPVLRSNDAQAHVSATLNGQPFASGTSVTSSGDYALAATAADTFGHSASANASFKVDLSPPPTIDITSPPENATVAGSTVAVSGTVSASVVKVAVNGRVAVLTGTSWSIADLALASDALNDIVAVGSDAQGRSATATRQVMARSSGPQVLILDPPDGFRTNRKKIDVAGAVVGGPSMTANGTVVVAGAALALDALGTFRANDVPLADGANTLVASATDALGRTGTAQVVVTTDTVAPLIAITAEGQPLLEGATFARAFTVRVEITDNTVPLPIPVIRLNGQDRGATAAVTDLPISQNGGYILSVDARDAAGNESRADRSFILASGGCSVSGLDPADGTALAASSVTLHGKSGDAQTVSVIVSGQTFAAQLADGTFAAGGVPLPVVGDNALQIACTDRSGATTTTSLKLTRLADGPGPVVHVTAPANGARQTAASAAAAGTVSDASAAVAVNGVKAVVAPDGTFSLAALPLVEGPNVFAARALDAAGRSGEDRVVVYRDSAVPKVSVTSPPDGAHVGQPGTGPAVVNVTGAVDLTTEPNLASVVVASPAGSVTATVDPDSGAFFAAGVPLVTSSPGTPQTLTATATDTLSQVGTASVSVVFDPTAPALVLSLPIDLTRYTETSPPSFGVAGEAWAKDGAQISLNGGGLDPATLSWDAPAADGRRHAAFSAQVTVPDAEGPFGLIARVEEPSGAYANDRRVLYKDVTAPTVLELSPADGAKQVDANEIPLALFSEPVKPSSLGASDGLTLTRVATGDKAVGTFTIAGNAVAFVPGAALARGEDYLFRAGSGVADLAGHPLAAAVEARFTVATLSAGVAPVLDPIPAVICAAQLAVTGTAAPNAAVRLKDGDLSFTGNADAADHFSITIPLSGNGFHAVHAAILDRDGAGASPEATALFRVDCSAPSVLDATLDRTSGRITVSFSEAMGAASLTLGGTGRAITVSRADDATHAPQAAALALSQDGATATLDLGSGPGAWWQNISVRLLVGPPGADASGNLLASAFETVFFAGGGGDLSGGFLSGEAYDDESGRPLEGASVALFASGAALPGSVPAAQVSAPVVSTVTDGRGRFSLVGDVAAGRYALVLSRSVYSRAVRRLALEPAVGAVPFDSRLTPLGAQAATLLHAAAGGTFAGPAGTGLLAAFAPGALSSSVDLGVRLTALSGQGLPEPLPLGWTPLAAAELRLVPGGAGDDALPEGAGTPFSVNAVQLTLALPAGVPSSADLFAARYDVAAGAWLALPVPVRAPGSGGADTVTVALAGPGAVAVILADDDPATRPPVLPTSLDAPLVGTDLPSSLPALTASIGLDPAIVSPTGRATASVVARSADGTTPWPSGLAVQAYLDEKLILSGGGELYEAPFSSDLILYHPPLAPADVGASAPGAVGSLTFRISPSPRAAQVLLDTGYENVRVFPFTDQLERGQVLGPSGGSVSSADGVELFVPESALSQKTVVVARLLSSSELPALPVPAGFSLVAGVRVDLSGLPLARGATLKINAPAGLPADAPDDPRLVLATTVDQPDDGRGAFARVIARVSLLPAAGSVPAKLVGAPEAPDSPLPLSGITGEGVFLFLHANAPVGFATGRVTAPNGAGYAGSRVTAQGLGTADLSQPGGRYAVSAPAGAPTLNALHPTLGVSGTAQVPSLAKGQIAQIDIIVAPTPPRIVSLQPPAGATNQPVGTTVAILFSAALDPASVSLATLTLELANADGTGTGLLFGGAVALAADRATLIFSPTRPLPPGRTILASFKVGVRSSDGTLFAGTLPVAWTFTTSTVFLPGGNIHPEKIRLLLPVNGAAQIVGADGALPLVLGGTTPWSAWADVDGALACPSLVTVSANANGGFTANVGCPPTVIVTLASHVFIHVLDPTGTQAATWRLGPFVTPDGTGFVAPPGEDTVFTSAEGVEVTAPAAAFDVPTLVKVTKVDPATLGVSAPQGTEIAASVHIDFDGTANETLRLRIPTSTAAPVGSLVAAGSPVDLPWGRRLMTLELGRVVADSSGQKFLSTAEGDQPSDPSSAAAPASRKALALPGKLIRTILAEFTARATGIFIAGSSAELAAITGQAPIWEIGEQFEVLYNFYADSFVYQPLPHDWTGQYILPVVVGSPLRIVIRDGAAGWIRAQQDFAGVTGGGGSLIRVAEFAPGTSAPPSILDGAPFHFTRFHAPLPDGDLSCIRLRLEIDGCSTNVGTALLRSTGDFLLAEGGQVELFNMDQGARSGPSNVDASGVFGDASVAAKGNDELMAVVSPGDVDPGTLTSFTFVFSRALLQIQDPTTFAKLFDCGPRQQAAPCANAPMPVESSQSAEGDRISIVPAGMLPSGHTFRLELNAAVIQASGASGPVGYADWAPSSFTFATRSPAGPVGSLPNPDDSDLSLGNTNSARDLLKFGNILMVASAGAKILAIDISDPARPSRFAVLNNADLDVRALATDGHNRLFYNFVGAATWGVGAIRIEDVRHATLSACLPDAPAWASQLPCFDRVLGGVRTAFALGSGGDLTGSEYLSLTGSLPTGSPTSMQILVSDFKEDEQELRDFYDGHVSPGAFDQLTPDGDGFYALSFKVDTKDHRISRGESCTGEAPWDHYQRVTVDDVTTSQSWSFDVENPWPDSPGADGTLVVDGIRARRGDRLRVRYNLRTLGYLAILGSGISVVDLNRAYRTPLVAGVGTGGQNNLGQCGRRLGSFEGQYINFASCKTGGGREIPPPDDGIAFTSDLVVLPAPAESSVVSGGGAGTIEIFGALRNFGAVEASSEDVSPGDIQGDAECLRGLGNVSLRSVALAEGVSYLDEGNRVDLSTGAVIRLPAFKPATREDRNVVFLSLGDAGILAADVTDGFLEPIALLQRQGHSIFRLQADANGGRLFAGGNAGSEPVIDVWSIATLDVVPLPNGSDPRFLFSVAAPWDTNHIALDETGTGLLYTWGQGTSGHEGGFAIPVADPQFVYAGVYLEGENGVVPGTPSPVVRVAARLHPLGVPTRTDPKDEVDPAKRNEAEQKVTAAFKVRLALPGGLGIPENDLDEITAKVQTLRELPDARLLAQENLGRAVAVPGGSAWPARDVYVRLKRVGKATRFDSPSDTGENGRFSGVYNLYESQEVVVLLADPRARKAYRTGAAGTATADISSERLQCRRCDRPAYLSVFQDSDVKELLAGGPYLRAFLAVDPDSPGDVRSKTQKALDFFADPAIRLNYHSPIGTVPVAAWADSVPSAVQVSQAEPAQNAAAFSPGEAGVNVSLVSGEVVLKATDHTAMGRGMAFLFDRTYRSGMAGYGPLGAGGWGANLFAHLRVLPPIEELNYPGEIEYHDGSGNVFRFYPPQKDQPPPAQCPPTTELDTAGSFCVTKGLYVRLIQLEAGKGWRLLDRQHGMLSFDGNGLLVDGSDRFRQGEDDPDKKGNTLRFGYDGFGFLVHVEDDLGRPYQFIYKDDPVADGPEYGLLARMKDFDGREVQYEYDAGHERLLTGVTFPGVTNPFYPAFDVPTPKVTYSYADPGLSPNAPLHEQFGKLRLQDFTLPGGTKPRAGFGFDPASGRLSEIRFPTDGVSQITWTLTDYQGPPDQASSGASVIAPWGHRTDYAFENGRIATKTQILPYVQPSDGTQIVATTITQHAYSEDGRPLSVTWPDSSITTYCYADVGSGTCPDAGNQDRLSRPNVLGISRARGNAPKGPALHDDTIETSMQYGEDNVINGATDPLGRPVTQAVPTVEGSSPSGYPGEEVYGNSTFDIRGRLTNFSGGTLPTGTPPVPPGPNGEKRDTPLSMIFTYEEDKSSPNYGRLVQMTKGAVGESYIYDAVGNLTQKTMSYGAVSTMSYDAWDRQIQSTEGISANPVDPTAYQPVPGVVTQRAFDASGHLVRERRNQDPLGWVELQYVYNEREQLVGVYQTQLGKSSPDALVDTNPLLITQNDHDPGTGLILSSTSAEGTVTHYGYDSAGRLTTTQAGLVPAQSANPQSTGGLREQAYDVMGRVALTTDGDRGVWRGKYDAWGRLYQEILPTGSVLEREHDKAGNVVRETLFDGDPEKTAAPTRLAERKMTLNAFGAATEIRELLKPAASGEADVVRLTKRTYDTNGRVVAEQSGPDGGSLRREASLEYEAGTGRVLKRTDGAGNETSYTYGQASEWPTRTSEKETVPGQGPLIDANWMETQRDLLGRVVEVKMRGGETTTTRYDQAGNVKETTTGAGSTTSATYDGRGSVLKLERPNGRGVSFFGLDRDGRVVQRRSLADGQQPNDTFYEYDNPTGRLTRITRPDGTFETYAYNPDDTLDTWRTRSGVIVTHAYDDANRLIGRTPSLPANATTSVILDTADSYTYDAASRLSRAQRVTLGSGSAVPAATVSFEDYDTGGRPGREILGESAAKRDPLVRSYDVFDWPVAMTLPAGVGRAPTGSFLGYGHTHDDLDRTTGVCGDPTLTAKVACGGYQGGIGANFAWGGAARLYGVTTRGPLKTAHRYGYISGPGAQPPASATTGSDFRLGMLTVGSTGQDPVSFATQALDAAWGGLGYGYRTEDGVKLGRKVVDLGPSSVGNDPNTISLFSNEGWVWTPDNGLRLKEARPGLGRLDNTLTPQMSFDVFGYGYGSGDELKSMSRETSAQNDLFDFDVEGRIAARNGAGFHYDLEGRRQDDDRYLYQWNWRGELVSVTVKPSWPDGGSSPYADQQIRYEYDAMGRLLSRTHVGKLPDGETDEGKRPFIEKRRYLWDGDTLLSETAYAQDKSDGSEGPLRWRKSYIPGKGGLDDAVGVRVEIYSLDGIAVASEKLYSYLRDEQGTVTGLVEEKLGADPAKPPLLVRYLYDPYGQAHAEQGEELYRATYDVLQTQVTTPDGRTVPQNATSTAVPGALRLLFSEPIDLSTLGGLVVERRLTDGTWGALTASELAIGRETGRTEGLLILPLAGWERSTAYRVRLTSGLLATDGRSFPRALSLEVDVPATGDLLYDIPYPILYDNIFASGNDLDGAIPGGLNTLFQGLWTDPVTGIAFARARWYDARNASFLQEDPEGDSESLNLYAFVGMRPNELTDPMGLLGFGDWLEVADDAITGTFKGTVGLIFNQRVQGAVQALAGVGEVVAGTALLLAPDITVTKVVGAVALVHGIDDVAAGLKTAITGKQTDTLTKRGIQKGLETVGVSADTADKIATGVDLGIGIFGAGAALKKAGAVRDVLASEGAETRIANKLMTAEREGAALAAGETRLGRTVGAALREEGVVARERLALPPADGPGFYAPETASMKPAAAAYQNTNVKYSVPWRKKPSPRSRNVVDFERWDSEKQQLVDRKLDVVRFGKSTRQAQRQAEVARQHGVGVRWEMPPNKVNAGKDIVKRANAGDVIQVVPWPE